MLASVCVWVPVSQIRQLSKPLFPRGIFLAPHHDPPAFHRVRRREQVAIEGMTMVSRRQEVSEVNDCEEHDRY